MALLSWCTRGSNCTAPSVTSELSPSRSHSVLYGKKESQWEECSMFLSRASWSYFCDPYHPSLANNTAEMNVEAWGQPSQAQDWCGRWCNCRSPLHFWVKPDRKLHSKPCLWVRISGVPCLWLLMKMREFQGGCTCLGGYPKKLGLKEFWDPRQKKNRHCKLSCHAPELAQG